MSIKNTGKALALSVFSHLLVLAILLGEFDSFIESKLKKRIDDSSQQSTVRITYVALTPEITSPTETLTPNTDTTTKQKKTLQSLKAEQTTAPFKAEQSALSPESQLHALKASKYYSSGEVLEPAQPLGDWVLETNTLLSGRVYQIFIQIWILETGEFEKFELIESSLTDEIARLATLNLLQTPMAPATQDGKPVASTRRLAILIDKDE